METDAEKMLAFQNETSQRIAREEQDTRRAKTAGASLICAVLTADPTTLPDAVRAAREELLKCST